MKPIIRYGLIIGGVALALCLPMAIAALTPTETGHLIRYKLKGMTSEGKPLSSVVSACKAEMKRTAHDPDSLDWQDEPYWRNVTHGLNNSSSIEIVLNMRLRGRNAFGALVLAEWTCTAWYNDQDTFVVSLLRAQD